MSERDEFDAWFRKEQSKDYFWDYVSAFAGWQGARATPPQAVPALTSLCQWLLHRFGPDSPEGREAYARLHVIQPSQEPERIMITEIPDGSIGMEGLQHNALLRRYQD